MRGSNLLAIGALVLATCLAVTTSEEEREKRQAPTGLAFPAGVAYLALWSLVTLRLLSAAVRLNHQNQELLKQQQIQPQLQQHPLLVQQQPIHPVHQQQILQQQQQQQQQQQLQQSPGTIRVQFNLVPTTTQRSGYVNPHVKREVHGREERATGAASAPQIDVDKMLELIRKLDKANCIPLLVCQLYANDNKKSYGMFEKSVIKFVEEYDGPGSQQGRAGSHLKTAARLGRSQKSEGKCNQAFPNCPISASQMSQVFKSSDTMP